MSSGKKSGAPAAVSTSSSSSSADSLGKDKAPSPPSSPKASPKISPVQTKRDEVKAKAQQFAASKKKKGGLDTQTVLMGLAGVTVLFAIVLFLKAPESPTGGASDSRNLLIQGINYLNGEGVTKDEEKAVEFLKRSAALGQPEAQHRLGYIYTYGTEVIEADPALAYDYYIKAAKQGVVDSMVNVGMALANGHGTEADIPEAFRWWKKAANRGSPIATGNVGRCYEAGVGGEVNLEKAMEFYKKGVLLEDGGSMHHLAQMYLKGINTGKDVEKGVFLLQQSANKGYILGMSALGEILYKGVIVAHDIPNAMQLLSKAAERGDSKAIYLIGISFLSNQSPKEEGATVNEGETNIYGLPFDVQRGSQTIEKAAQAGSSEASFYMARMLEQGAGVKADSQGAYNWLFSAAQAGNPDAAYELLTKDGTSSYGGLIKLDHEDKEQFARMATRSEHAEVRSAAIKLLAEYMAGDDDEQDEEEHIETVHA